MPRIQWSLASMCRMKQLVFLCSLLIAVFGCQRATNAPGLTLYLQLVRGSDQDTAPTPDARPIELKLSNRLHSVLKWKNYWELKRDFIVVSQGQKLRRRLSPEREVEIEFLDPQQLAARIYVNGKLTQCRKQPAKAAFYVAGGDQGADQSWFIVVREDRPLTP